MLFYVEKNENRTGQSIFISKRNYLVYTIQENSELIRSAMIRHQQRGDIRETLLLNLLLLQEA